MLMLELNNVFTKAYSHFSQHGNEEDREYLQELIALLKGCLTGDSAEDESDTI